MFDLTGMKTVIFGGTAGIGLAVAKRFVAAGSDVVIVGRRDAIAIAAEIGATGLSGDVTIENDVKKVLEEAQSKHGLLDVIINNAGKGITGKRLTDESAEALNNTLDVNLKGVFYGLKHGPRFMRDGGSIINTSSAAGLIGLQGYGPYAASKAATLSLTATAAIELAARGIRVNAVCPGSIRTEMLEKNPTDEIEIVKRLAPLGRIGELADIVGIYHFLASRESAYITGTAIPVDGGILAGFSTGVMEMLAK